MWKTLPVPWRACLELIWEAYCDDCYPIGAVVTSSAGEILSRGRNRVYPRRMWGGRSRGVDIAHAEVEALHNLEYDGIDQHACCLYTTTEPCPMCLGTFYMSGLRTLHYASREPFAGSLNLLGTTCYLSRKTIKVVHPFSPELEIVLVAMAVEQGCSMDDGELPENDVYRRWAEVIPGGVELGRSLARSGSLHALRGEGARAEQVINDLIKLVK